MTFTEAAVEVLRLVGKPLHYKKITEIAIDRNLLSHVGKTPEITMSSRLATMVKKDRGDAPIIKVKPGVFGLREFSADVLKAAESESGHEYDLPKQPDDGGKAKGKGKAKDQGKKGDDDSKGANKSKGGAKGGEPEKGADVSKEPGAKQGSGEGDGNGSDKPKLPGAEIFPEEEDDDEPILAKIGDDSDRSEGKRSRKRRRRKRKGGGSEGRQDRPEGRKDRSDGGQRNDSDSRARSRSRNRSRSSGDGGGAPRVQGDWNRVTGEDEPAAQDLADAVEAVLEDGNGKPMTHAKIAAALIKRGRLSGDASALAPTVAAAILGDGSRRRVAHRRPRFRLRGDGVSLTNWDLPNEAVRAERDAWTAAAKQRDAVHRAFLRRISNMPATAFMELVAAWLNAEGIVSLRGVRTPAKGGYHLAGTVRRGGQETRTAVILWRDGSPVGREQVIEVRGGLHHYGNASTAWLVTTGRVHTGAWEEAAVPGQAPCMIYDGPALARAMEAMGIGLRPTTVPLSEMDLDLLDALSPSPADIEDVTPEDESDDGSAGDDGSDGDDEDPQDDSKSGRSKSRRRRRRRGGRGRGSQEGESDDGEKSEDDETSGDDEPESKGKSTSKGDDSKTSEDDEPKSKGRSPRKRKEPEGSDRKKKLDDDASEASEASSASGEGEGESKPKEEGAAEGPVAGASDEAAADRGAAPPGEDEPRSSEKPKESDGSGGE